MRCTLRIDDDVVIAVKERAVREKRAMGEVLSELARTALTGQVVEQRAETVRHGFRPLPHRGPVVANTLIDELRGDDAT